MRNEIILIPHFSFIIVIVHRAAFSGGDPGPGVTKEMENLKNGNFTC